MSEHVDAGSVEPGASAPGGAGEGSSPGDASRPGGGATAGAPDPGPGWDEALAEQRAEGDGEGEDALDVARAPLEELRPGGASGFGRGGEGSAPGSPTPDLEAIMNIPVTVSMEVGRTQLSIRNLLQLNQGSVVELDRLAGEPLDVLVNGTLIAHGEVVVVNERFGIRLTDVISAQERVKKLR